MEKKRSDNIFYKIAINRDLKLGIFNPISDKENSFVYDLEKGVRREEEKKFEILDISPDGRYIALAEKKWNDNNLFLINDRLTGEAIYETKKHLVYDAWFSPLSDYIVARTFRNGGFCLKIGGDIVIPKLPADPLYVAMCANSFLYTSERRKGTFMQVDFSDLVVSQYTFDAAGCIQEIGSDSCGNIYTVDSKYVARKHASDLTLLWEKDNKKVYGAIWGEYAPAFYISEELDLMVYGCQLTDGSFLGQRLSTGEEVFIENKSNTPYFVIGDLYDGKRLIESSAKQLFDLETGECTPLNIL